MLGSSRLLRCKRLCHGRTLIYKLIFVVFLVLSLPVDAFDCVVGGGCGR